jgi:saccharopine dehydrogenase-like NADP-dependent oxidoreductase
MVVLQHTFEIETSQGERKTRKSTLIEFGERFREGSGGEIEGISAMSKLVGVPCGIAVQLLLDGELKRPGVHAPYQSWIVDPLLRETLKEGIEMKEEESEGFS